MTFSNQQNKTSPLDIIKQLMPTPGMGARLLCVLLTIITLMSALVAESHPWLMIHRSTIQNTQFTSLFTNTFVARPSGFFNLLIFIALGVYFFKDLFALWWRRDRAPLVVAIVGPLLAVFVVELILGGGRGWGLTTSLMVTLWFAIPVEREWGSRRLVIFCVVVVIMVNTTGALLLWAWPEGVTAALNHGAAPINGMSSLSGSLIAVWALMIGNRRLAIINIEGKTVVWLLVVIGALDFILQGRIKGIMDLVAIGCAFLLITGYWRPRFAMDRLRLWLLERRVERRRGSLHIVDRDDRTLH